VRVAVWHTNVVIAEVPDGLTDKEATEHVLGLVDVDQAHFESVEGGVHRDDAIPKWWTDHLPLS
jgi:hypothetical protein